MYKRRVRLTSFVNGGNLVDEMARDGGAAGGEVRGFVRAAGAGEGAEGTQEGSLRAREAGR